MRGVRGRLSTLLSADMHLRDLAWTSKAFQEVGLHTDLEFICTDGLKVSVHSAFFLRHSVWLSDLLSRFSCCYCHGTSCGGRTTASITLADVSKATFSSLLEVVYTGRTYLTDQDEYTNLLGLVSRLKMNLPPSTMSLERQNATDGCVSIDIEANNGLSSFFKRAISQAESMQEVVDFSLSEKRSSSRKRKISQLVEQHDDDEEDQQHLKRLCVKCNRRYHAKNWYGRHVKTCKGFGQEAAKVVVHQEPSAAKSEKKKVCCTNCGQYFALQGGWWSRHQKKCIIEREPQQVEQQQEQQQDQEDLEEAIPSMLVNTTGGTLPEFVGNKRLCKGCHKYFSNTGGWYQKHLAVCDGLLDNEAVKKWDKKELTCGKCGKQYSPHCRRFLAQHVNQCTGQTAAAAAAEQVVEQEEAVLLPPPLKDVLSCHVCQKTFEPSHVGRHRKHVAKCEAAVPEAAEEANGVVNVSQYVAMYEKGDWNCFLCPKMYARKDILRQHLLMHNKAELAQKYVYGNHDNDNDNDNDSLLQCAMCSYVGLNVKSLLQHIGLTHQRIRDYVPKQLASFLFNKSEWKCFKCHEDLKGKDDLVAHLVCHHFKQELLGAMTTKCDYCVTFASQDSDVLVTHVALVHEKLRRFVPKEQEHWLLGSGSKVKKTKMACHICQFEAKERSELRQHVFGHLKEDIRAKCQQEGVGRNCKECKYKSEDEEHLLMHLALTHQKLRDFVPQHMGDLLYEVAAAETAEMVACVRCKNKFGSKEELKRHLDTCFWKCSRCSKELKEPKAIKKHRETCGKSDEEEGAGGKTTSMACHLCQRVFNQFHYMKGHLSMHYRDQLREKVNDCAGGLGGTGFTCRQCEFVSATKDSLVTHIGYKHAMFVEFLPEAVRLEFFEFAKTAGEKAGLPPPTNSNNATFKCPGCDEAFESQVKLASHMTNVNCRSKRSNPKCLLCRAEVGSLLQYKCHLMGHFQTQLEAALSSQFKLSNGRCPDCRDDKEMPFAPYIRHAALEHDKIFEYLPEDVKKNMVESFECSDVPQLQKTVNEEVNINEEIHIQIESVDDVVEATAAEEELLVVEEEEPVNNGKKELHMEPTKVLKCNKCDLKFANQTELDSHTTTSHCKDSKSTEKPPPQESTRVAIQQETDAKQ